MRKSPVPSMQLTDVRAHVGVPLPGSHVSLSFCPHVHVRLSAQSYGSHLLFPSLRHRNRTTAASPGARVGSAAGSAVMRTDGFFGWVHLSAIVSPSPGTTRPETTGTTVRLTSEESERSHVDPNGGMAPLNNGACKRAAPVRSGTPWAGMAVALL